MPKIIPNIELINTTTNPPPLGTIFVWELLLLGISGSNFLSGLIESFTKNQEDKIEIKKANFKILILFDHNYLILNLN